MNKRQIAILLVLIMIAAIIAVLVFLSLGKNDYALARQSGTEVVLADLAPGEFDVLTVNGQTLWAYHRTDKEIEQINRLSPFLVDPLSIESKQPETARNRFRSAKQAYFIFYPESPVLSCQVKFNAPSEFEYDELYTAAPIHEYTHFREPCEGHLFDTAGRVLKTGDYNGEKNLPVPNIIWTGDNKFVFLEP